MTEKYYRKVFR